MNFRRPPRTTSTPTADQLEKFFLVFPYQAARQFNRPLVRFDKAAAGLEGIKNWATFTFEDFALTPRQQSRLGKLPRGLTYLAFHYGWVETVLT
jgi:hypothetical protein